VTSTSKDAYLTYMIDLLPCDLNVFGWVSEKDKHGI